MSSTEDPPSPVARELAELWLQLHVGARPKRDILAIARGFANHRELTPAEREQAIEILQPWWTEEQDARRLMHWCDNMAALAVCGPERGRLVWLSCLCARASLHLTGQDEDDSAEEDLSALESWARSGNVTDDHPVDPRRRLFAQRRWRNNSDAYLVRTSAKEAMDALAAVADAVVGDNSAGMRTVGCAARALWRAKQEATGGRPFNGFPLEHYLAALADKIRAEVPVIPFMGEPFP